MKNLLSFSEGEKRWLKLGVLILAAVLFLSNIKPLYQGVVQLPIWQTKPRPAERSPNFKAPPGYQGDPNALGTARFVTLDVLVMTYKRIGEFEISPAEVDEIRQGVELAREFFWRNTRLQLNLALTFLEIEDKISNELLDEEGKIWPKPGLLEEDLLQRGVEKNQYDCVFLFYPTLRSLGEGGSGSGMELKRLGKSSYSFSSLPVEETAWIFARELWYSINTVVYEHDSEEIKDWEALASILRPYPIQDPPKPYGKIYLTLDFDLDGVPDDEPMVPFYEVSLGLNYETTDSDNDGLEDKKEVTAGIFRGTDLFLQDTDGDDLKDGEDPYPFDPELPEKAPSDD